MGPSHRGPGRTRDLPVERPSAEKSTSGSLRRRLRLDAPGAGGRSLGVVHAGHWRCQRFADIVLDLAPAKKPGSLADNLAFPIDIETGGQKFDRSEEHTSE